MANLRLSSTFELVVLPKSGGGTISQSQSASESRAKTAPFTLTVSLLAGGGWFETRTTYAPLSGRITAALSIGITAGAMLAFSLGPLKGAVSILFGVFADYEIQNTGGGRGLTIGFNLLIRGELEVLGFVSVSLILMLEATYNNGTLKGRGTIQIRVKICWCFTLKFSAGVEYTFKDGGGGGHASLLDELDLRHLAVGGGRYCALPALDDEYTNAAKAYIENVRVDFKGKQRINFMAGHIAIICHFERLWPNYDENWAIST